MFIQMNFKFFLFIAIVYSCSLNDQQTKSMDALTENIEGADLDWSKDSSAIFDYVKQNFLGAWEKDDFEVLKENSNQTITWGDEKMHITEFIDEGHVSVFESLVEALNIFIDFNSNTVANPDNEIADFRQRVNDDFFEFIVDHNGGESATCFMYSKLDNETFQFEGCWFD